MNYCNLKVSTMLVRKALDLSWKVCRKMTLHPRYFTTSVKMSAEDDVHVVDLRSDCLSRPSPAMVEAMTRASYGDDVFVENTTALELQARMAELCGMEDALFVPSGTMGNLLSVMCHCPERGQEVLLGSNSHLTMYEQGGIATLGGVHPRTIPNLPDGTFDLDSVESYIRPLDDPHQPHTKLIAVENTHNNCGGKLKKKADEFGVPVHMDGARLLNASVALNVPPKEILQYANTTSVCLSKGVGAPVGSVIAGPADFIARARRLRKAMGGGWRKPGCLAAAALVGLDTHEERLRNDHKHAKMLANGIMEASHGVVKVDIEDIHTNLVFIHIVKPGLTAEEFCKRLNEIGPQEGTDLGAKVQVKMMAFAKFTPRAAFCNIISDTDSQLATKKIAYVCREMASQQSD